MPTRSYAFSVSSAWLAALMLAAGGCADGRDEAGGWWPPGDAASGPPVGQGSPSVGSDAGSAAPAAPSDGGARADAASEPRGGEPDAGAPPAPDAAAPGSDAALPARDAGATPDATAPRPDAAGEVGSCNEDPRAVLRRYMPADEDLAGDYAKYLDAELGELDCRSAGQAGSRTITRTIFVPPNVSYDGRGERLTADVAAMRCDTTEGEQAESQRPFFLLAPGARLSNVTITYPGCEGVHMMGDNVLDRITWEDAGEDAASVRSYFPGGAITIRNSEGHKAADKMFQFNAACDVRIESFRGSDMGKLVRQNGGTDFKLSVDLNTVDVSGVISAVVQSDSPSCYVRYHALHYMFTGSGDKSDRVFRDIPAANIMEY
jgi:pectate lyase C